MRLQWEYDQQLVVDIYFYESLDSEPERDACRRGGGDPDPDILLELEQGGLRFRIREGSRASGSRFSMANGASAQVSVQSKGTY